ncbi:MAG: nitrilase-related carbon-nitrogen hydrolase [Metallosphaera sp.]|uniref:nitrilase-related carbon-nitrogen hydrolase n=1 Tax=Metallosphaera sp. TaxID=2020860 RepID=UPI00316A507B
MRVQGYMYPPRDLVSTVSKAMAWANNSYVAVSNLAGFDGTYYYFGHSMIVGFDGRELGEAGESPGEIVYAQLSIPEIRRTRRTWLSENHLYKLLHRGYTATSACEESETGIYECPFDFYKLWVDEPLKAKEMVEDIKRPPLSKGLQKKKN